MQAYQIVLATILCGWAVIVVVWAFALNDWIRRLRARKQGG